MRKNILMPVASLVLLAFNLVALNTLYSKNLDYMYYSWAIVLFSAVLFGIVAIKKLNNK